MCFYLFLIKRWKYFFYIHNTNSSNNITEPYIFDVLKNEK